MVRLRRVAGCDVFPVGLGCMPLSHPDPPPERRAIATIHAALDAGVTLLDTADAYARGARDIGANERLVARALRGRSEDVLLATKGGHTRTAAGGWELDGSPEHLRRACEASLRALDVDAIGLYQYHRPDPRVPFAESVGALRELRDEGKIRHVGLSNVTVAQIDEAEAIVEIAAVQNELSLRYVEPLRNGELAACAARAIALLPWSPLGGAGRAADQRGDGADAVADIARARGASPQQVTLAWLLALADVVVPIPGARRPETIRDSAAAATLDLAPGEVDRITAAAVGERAASPTRRRAGPSGRRASRSRPSRRGPGRRRRR